MKSVFIFFLVGLIIEGFFVPQHITRDQFETENSLLQKI